MRAWLVQGMAFGDEGKGTVVDALVKRTKSKLVVRFNGGPQAAHHVVTDDDRMHCFHQFGAGTFHGARTHLSRFMLVEPFALRDESVQLMTQGVAHPLGLISMDPRALVITPYHQMMNRLRELSRGDARHGSCGMGVGEAVSDSLNCPASSIQVGWLSNERRVRALLEIVRAQKLLELERMGQPDGVQAHMLIDMLTNSESAAVYARRYRDIATHLTFWRDDEVLATATSDVVFEGSQGVLLDQVYGFAPFHTWSNTTFGNGIYLCAEAGIDRKDMMKVGVWRSYFTRHGAGPFPTEQDGFEDELPGHNVTGEWQGAMRSGAFDMVLARYATKCCDGIDYVALTHMDKVTEDWPVCHVWTEMDGNISERVFRAQPMIGKCQPFTGYIEKFIAPLLLTSHGPRTSDKTFVTGKELREKQRA